MTELKNKVAAITGAGSGIGQAIAIELAKEGCAVALSDINSEALESTEALMKPYGINVSKHIVDVSDKDSVEQYAQAVQEEHGHVDILINNAGVTVSQTTLDIDYKDFEWIMQINFWGVVYCTKAFLPHMCARNAGHIVNTSSILGFIGSSSQPSYAATKYAVNGFTESLRFELQNTPISVSCVFPGGVRNTGLLSNSRIYKDIVDGGVSEATKQSATERFNAAFGLSTPEEIAAKIVVGIKKKRARILVGKDSKFFDFARSIVTNKLPYTDQLVLPFFNLKLSP